MAADDAMTDEDLKLSRIAGPDAVAHLKVLDDGICWWCRSRPATTGEHKFKRSNLSRLMLPGDLLLWGNGVTQREIRGKAGIDRDRFGVIKFPKSMCGLCNNSRSRPFDLAYDEFSHYVERTNVRVGPGLTLLEIYGDDWERNVLDLARYHAKHFGCRMNKDKFPVPQSLRDFLNGATDMSDARMSIISTDSIHKSFKGGMSISPGFVWTDPKLTRFTQYVTAAYIGSIGVRYEWVAGGIPDLQRSQFFHYPYPVINFFRDDVDMSVGVTRKPGRFARFMQWVNKP